MKNWYTFHELKIDSSFATVHYGFKSPLVVGMKTELQSTAEYNMFQVVDSFWEKLAPFWTFSEACTVTIDKKGAKAHNTFICSSWKDDIAVQLHQG